MIENNDNKSAWKIRFVTLLIFFLGIVAGVVGSYSYEAYFPAAKNQTRREKYEEAFNRLGMTEAQRTEVDQIITDLRQRLVQLRQDAEPKVQEIRAESDARLQTVLTPEQWQQFQADREQIRQAEREKYTSNRMR